MKANAVPLIALFERKMRLEIPLFQRPYVWSENQQWAPLWEDIERKFTEYLEGRQDIPVHFLGAIVLDQKLTPATHVERRLVIDGQQRLTTLQIFLNSFRDFCKEVGADALSDECASYTLNKGMMPDPLVDRYKVWPTQLDRPDFMAVVDSGSPKALEEKFPLKKQKYARRFDPRPKIVECYLYFYTKLQEYFVGNSDELPLANDYPIDQRLEQCFQALRSALMVVAIDLEQGDDAQVIFETLNARGQALLPADLLRNFVFLRATRNGEKSDSLYETYWSDFDQPYWQESVSQGRLNRPRSDLFIQHFLVSQQLMDIPIGHLYVEYRHWIEKNQPFKNVEQELSFLSKGRSNFRAVLNAEEGKPFTSLARLLRSYDIGTVYPLLLILLDMKLSDDELKKICTLVESYLLRRAVCSLTNKNYNRVFLQLSRTFKKERPTAISISTFLKDLRGESTEWPSDENFSNAWRNREIYTSLSAPRIVYILSKLNDSFASSLTETIEVDEPLSIEHLMPQSWIANWPLPNGEKGVDEFGLLNVDENSDRAKLTQVRNCAIQRIGNLTLVRKELNSSLANGRWSEKKNSIMDHSLLPINLPLQGIDNWNEDMMTSRSNALLERALKIWPR